VNHVTSSANYRTPLLPRKTGWFRWEVFPDGRNSGQISQKGSEKNVVGREKMVAKFQQIFVRSGRKGARNFFLNKDAVFSEERGVNFVSFDGSF